MTVEEIFEILAKYNITAQKLYACVEGCDSITVDTTDEEYEESEEERKEIDIEDLFGGVYVEEEEGGYEGGGESWTVIFCFKDHNVYLRADGYYSSWGESDLDSGDGLYHVVPTQRMTTYYEKPKNNTQN